MRVLWFCNTPSNYSHFSSYQGGGWISSLEQIFHEQDDIELGISFLLNNQPEEIKIGRTTYFPIPNPRRGNRLARWRNLLTSPKNNDEKILRNCVRVIEQYKPDIIHVFGLEDVFGLVTLHTPIPVVLHIQGIIHPIYNALLPPFVSWKSWIFSDFRPNKIKMRIEERRNWKHRLQREKRIFNCVHNYIGRTEWDNMISYLLSPGRNYFHIDETLRETFYKEHERNIPTIPIIVSTLSDSTIKGIDTVLKTAHILKEIGINTFKWLVYGLSSAHFAVKATGILPSDVNVQFCGTTTANNLSKALTNCTVFVHLSYIDNSPNSVCEAQMCSCPVIASNVGGKSSLVRHGIDGFLVPCNAPYETAYYIIKLFDPKLNISMGKEARRIALKRHSPGTVLNNLLEVYNKLIIRPQ
jgi:glycosyltransferase involved in cell wall biosynthesis